VTPPASSQPRITSLPNLLGLARILATPVVIAFLLLPFPGAGAIACVLFVAAAATDWLDGRIARARGEVSPLGVFVDLTADKVLVAGVLVGMVEARLLPTWIVAIILIRELVIQGVRQFAATGNVVIAARRLGKSKTLTTLLAMAILLLVFDARTGGPMQRLGIEPALSLIGFWLMVLATVLTVVSGIDYLRGALPMLAGRGDDQPGG
jgi:CDP-diacylglycerol--glycerol-3-phosphate 3-phosphatidyltransferase